MNLVPTASQTVGPYFHLGLTSKMTIPDIAGPAASGERVRLTCRVLDGDGVPVPDAMIEIWQADAGGRYHHPDDPHEMEADASFGGFGRLPTTENGECLFETIMPGRVPAGAGTLQAPHLNLSVFARGVLKRLATRIYFAGNPANQDDPVLGLVAEDRRESLMAQPEPDRPTAWRFEIRLSGERETVFFDV